MSSFTRPDDETLQALAAAHGTPLWIYDASVLDARLADWRTALEPADADICYAVKANGNLAILQRLARAGAGFDVVSGGELARVLAAGGDASRSVFSGVGKRVDEIDAALAAGIGALNCESAAELDMIDARARYAGIRAPVALRINPGVDAGTHRHIATGDLDDKFGVTLDVGAMLARHASTLAGVSLHGLAVHIGSQLIDLDPLRVALERVLGLHDTLVAEGLPLTRLDAGGGLGVRYGTERVPTVQAYADLLLRAVGDRALQLTVEPGRALTAECGVLLCRVELIKPGAQYAFVVVDAGMSELLRPALYDAWHPIELVGGGGGEAIDCKVVGPLCESGDVLGRGRRLAAARGDLLVIGCCGAYGASMSSHYNARPRVAEVLLADGQVHVIRARESYADLWRMERLLP